MTTHKGPSIQALERALDQAKERGAIRRWRRLASIVPAASSTAHSTRRSSG